MGKTGQRAPKLNYPKMDVLELATIERLVNLRGNDCELRTFYFRPRTQKVARTHLWRTNLETAELRARITSALAGSEYRLLGVQPVFRGGGYFEGYTIEVVKAQEKTACADSPFSAGADSAAAPASSNRAEGNGPAPPSSLLVAGAVPDAAPAGV